MGQSAGFAALLFGLFNRFSNAKVTAAEATRDGEFIGRNGPTAYKYGYACLQYGSVGSQSTNDLPGISQAAGAALGCASGVAIQHFNSQP